MTYDNRLLQLDYKQTTAYFHALAETRFKLLALLPITTGTAIVVLDEGTSDSLTLAVGLLGFVASFGLLVYDQRNTELYDRMQRRAKILEVELGFVPFFDERDRSELNLRPADVKFMGGPFLDRPRRGRSFYGLPLWHDLGLALVYSATLAGWVYLISSACARLLGASATLGSARSFGMASLVGAITFVGLMALDDPTDEQESLPVRYRQRVWSEREPPAERKSSLLSFTFGGGGIGIGIGLLLVRNPRLGLLVGLIVGVLTGLFGLWYRSRRRN